MDDLSIFFEGISQSHPEGTLGSRVRFHDWADEQPLLEAGTVVVIGVPECRRSSAQATSEGLGRIRHALYRLSDHFPSTSVIDFGNILPGESVEDTSFALSATVAEVVKQGCIVLIIGGGHDLTFANYLGYEKLERVVNLVTIDSRLDMGDADEEVTAQKFLQRIVLHQPNILFNFSSLGFQSYYSRPDQVEMMRKMYFDIYRLGEVQANLEECEPIVRAADIVSFDLSAIRSSDLPSNPHREPNGLYGEQACAICRYAGLSDKLTSFGIYEYDEAKDSDGRSAALIGQMLWYFLRGVDGRKRDYPFADKEDYVRYTVTIEHGNYDIIFYKSPRSDRWWMEVPYPSKRGQKYERHFMVPCSYEDYKLACTNEMPDRWWQTYQKLG